MLSIYDKIYNQMLLSKNDDTVVVEVGNKGKLTDGLGL